jgi:hypothetical protein
VLNPSLKLVRNQEEVGVEVEVGKIVVVLVEVIAESEV